MARVDPHIIMFFINCTWGIAQSFIGLFVFLVYIKKPHFWYNGSIVTLNSVPIFIGGFSLGAFVFLSHEMVVSDISSLLIYSITFVCAGGNSDGLMIACQSVVL